MSPSRGVRSVTVSLAALALVLALAGCGDSGTSASPNGGGQATPTTPAAAEPTDAESGPTEPTEPTPETTPEAEPSATPEPSEDATEPPDASPTPAATPGPGWICTGSAENKDFWTSAGAALSWDVYCPVLPKGWFVGSGTFDLTKLNITYVGPSGKRIELKEGAFCTAGLSACSPHDQVLGTASFGDRTGSLDSLGPGLGFAIYVDPGQPVSWSLSGTGMDQPTFVALAAALVKVPKH